MPLKESKGNMYEWVTHTHTHLGGECPHRCKYCYVENPRWGRPERYKGDLRLIQNEFKVNYGSGKTIFIENCNDMFAESVPTMFIVSILGHCSVWPGNDYVFQTKNPERYLHTPFHDFFPEGNIILGTTIETNRPMNGISEALDPEERVAAMERIRKEKKEIRTFVTIEPVLDFDVKPFAEMIARINPTFINLGADSKGHGLPEPTVEKVMNLSLELHKYGIELREKHNLKRLKGA